MMSHIQDYAEVEKEIKRKKTLKKIFLEENNMKPLDQLEMPTDDDLTPQSRSTNQVNFGIPPDQPQMLGIREQNEYAYEGEGGDGGDLFMPQQDAFNNMGMQKPNLFNFEDSDQNRRLLSQKSLSSNKMSSGNLSGNLMSRFSGKGTVVFDTPRDFELPSESHEVRSFKIPETLFEEYNYLDKKNTRYSSFF